MAETFQRTHGRLPNLLHKYENPLHVQGIMRIQYPLQIYLSSNMGDFGDFLKEISPGFFETPVFTKAPFFLLKYSSRLAGNRFSDSECFSHKQLSV